jgi:hypothetical protein
VPSAPVILGEAIGGIARHRGRENGPVARRAADHEPGQALWIEGKLSDARAASLLARSDTVALWVIEDFRKLALSGRMFGRIEAAGIRLCALRPIRASVLRFRK